MAGTLPPAVQQALDQGRFIEAIKLLRQGRGIGLKEAKDWIDGARAAGQAAGAAQRAPSAQASNPGSNGATRAGLGQPSAAEDAVRRARGLSPGEVPRVAESGWWIVIGLLLAWLVWRWWV